MFTLIVLSWIVAGIIGYIMMFLCDFITGIKYCDGKFYVKDQVIRKLIAAVTVAPLAFLVGLGAVKNLASHYSKSAKS